MKNIVITGEGIISAIGQNKSAVLESLRERKTGIGRMKHLRSVHQELPVGEVDLSDEEMKSLLGMESSKDISRTSLMGMLAIEQALKEARVKSHEGLRIVLISGTTVGGMDVTERYFSDMRHRGEHLDWLLHHDCGDSTKMMADYFGIFSEWTTLSTACSSAANAIILGARLLQEGQADIVVAGGTEALSAFHLNGFNSLMILDKEVCRPFDASRQGLNLGEGAAFVVMESEESAAVRQVPVHAWLSGYGNACDAFHQTASSENGEGPWLAMTEALQMADLKPADIQYVNAHGTGTSNNDQTESVALKRVFGCEMPFVSSTKSFTGHTTSASGSIETVICILALQHQFIPLNLGWSQPMDEGILPYMGGPLPNPIHHVLCNSFGFGGNDSCLILSDKGREDLNSELESDILDYRILSRVDITDEEHLGEIKQYVKPMEVRRMGKLMKSSLLSSLKALQQAGIEKPDAIITGTAWGCLENSELLLHHLTEEGEAMSSPTWFMQSTHNTISSNIAIRLKCHGYNVTYTQGSESLDWALRDALMLLKSGRYKTVLVGMHDETTPFYRQAMEQLGVKDLKSVHSVAMVLSVDNHE